MRVHARAVPLMREIVVIARLWLRQQRVLNAVSSPSMQVHYGPGAPQTHYRYASAGVGLNWETPWGAQGAQLGLRAASLVTAEMRHTKEARALERAWKEVE